MTTTIDRRQRALFRAIAVLAGLVVALGASCAWLLWHRPAASAPVLLPTRAGDFDDKEIFTPVPDPGLDFVFYPGMRNDPSWATQVPLSTNWSGLRYARELGPKANGTFRVVLLGDSMVAAQAARYEDGVAPQLEALLTRLATKPAGVLRFEVVPVAVSGWNLFASVRFVVHNLHVLQPDLAVLLLNRNDMDSGSGFLNGHTLTQLYDLQRLRGRAHASLGSPTYFLRAAAGCWGLVASDLIPESRRRFEMAGREIGDLQQRLQGTGATFFLYLYDDYLAPGLDRVLPASIDRRDVVLGPAAVTENNLLPLDGHPDHEGHAHLARVLAAHADRRGYLQVPGLGDVAAHQDLATAPVPVTKTRDTFAVERIPAGFAVVDGALEPRDAVRGIVGGVHPHAVLTEHAVFVLRAVQRPRVVRVVIDFPDVPALRGGTTQVFVGGVAAGALPMSGLVARELPVPADAEIDDLVEVSFVADRWYTNPLQGLRDGVWEAAPHCGNLRELRLVSD